MFSYNMLKSNSCFWTYNIMGSQAIESNQLMVMLLRHFEKAYDCELWSFLRGAMSELGFPQEWISWTSAFYIDAWCKVGINGS